MERLKPDDRRDLVEKINRLRAQEVRFLALIEDSPEDDLHIQNLEVCRNRILEYENRLKEFEERSTTP